MSKKTNKRKTKARKCKANHGSKPNAIRIAHGKASSVPAAKNAAGMLTKIRYGSGNSRGRISASVCR